ncbi:methionine aminopeptidase [uncultured Serinicoccus sp.]|uniref:methionine aminopeptidase n=1 Tax=uncultured Serinicoccus sp. TaxID=735514 RepID=UPI00263291D7|nr:methionine aminopeptidase [uncultured Serinicoccus sp.]
MQYWYNTKTGQVESEVDDQRARSADLLGPYASEDEASRALEIAREKTERWDEEEREDDNWDNNPFNDQG